MGKIHVTGDTRLDMPKVSLSLDEIKLLTPICIWGFEGAEEEGLITKQIRELISQVICGLINPLRPSIVHLDQIRE